MRTLATVCLAFSAGIFAAQYVLPQQWLLPLAAVCGVLALAAQFALKEKKRLRAVLILSSLALSLVYHTAYAALVQAPNQALSGTVETMTLELCDYAQETAQGAKAEVRILGRGLHGKAIYYGTESLLEYVPGQRVTVSVYCNDASRINESDVTTFTARGCYLLLYNRGEETCREETGAAWHYLPQELAHRTKHVISSVFPERTEPLLRAILLGDRSGFCEEDEVYLSEAGIYHITAVSGLHCAFLLSLLKFLIGAHRRKLLSAIAIPVLCFYALMVGASPSVVRACVMLILVLLAPLFERESDAPTSLSFALFLILLQNPFAAASVSLQLSFGAMAGILWLTPKLYAAIHTKRKALRFVLASFAATAGALVFTLPLNAYYFNSFVLISPISNLLCIWAASATFALGFACTLLGLLFLPLAQLIAYLPHLGALYILTVSKLLTKLPYHALYFSNDYLKYWLFYVYAMFGACYAAKKGKRRYLAASVLSAAALVLTVYLGTLPFADGSLHVVALDVGQGQSVVLHSDGKTALVDCGSSNTFVSAGDAAADYLQSAGEQELDYLVLSHYHADHINGVETLLSRMAVDTLVLPDTEDASDQKHEILQLAAKYRIHVLSVSETQRLSFGEAALTVYPPLGKGSTNEEGLTVLCTAGTFDVLLTGDMHGDTETLLIDSYDLPDIEMLMVGHHGSRYATSTELLEAVTPEIAVISVGSNSYGHPTDAALYRLSDEDISVYRTDLQGNIHITVN